VNGSGIILGTLFFGGFAALKNRMLRRFLNEKTADLLDDFFSSS
jgi:hypothetical protein